MVTELFPSVTYEFQIRAVDHANPPNRSAWSSSTAFTAARDTLPPAQPAAPVVAASRLAVQVVHYLGTNAGGTFNLDRDTQFLEVHVSGDASFFPDDSTLVGRLQVNAALTSQTPVVGTFQVEETTERYVRVVAVDREGNRSNASNTATATADLIDDAHISDLTVSKLTAGTLTSDVVLGATIRTGESGQRVELNSDGLMGYDDDGDLTINLSSSPSETGQYISFRDGDQILASIDDTGVASFQQLYAQNVWVPGGHLLDDYVELKPRGIVAFGRSFEDMEGRGINLERGYLELAFDAEEGRTYKITQYGEVESSSAAADERFQFVLLDGGTGIPDLNSVQITRLTFPAIPEATRNVTGNNVTILRCPEDLTAGTHRLLWSFRSIVGTATMRGADGPSLFYVEDVGPSDWYENIAVLNDGGFNSLSVGGGVSSDPKNPSPIKSYQATYECTWSGTYGNHDDATGYSYLIDELDDVRQGYSPTYGFMFGVIGFPEQMYADLLDANIVRMTLVAYANWWHR